MEKSTFQRQLLAYEQWKSEIVDTIEEYGPWLHDHAMTTPEGEERIRNALELLHNDHLTIAFVAEFSRGKTELINAIFFADYGRRLLPSAPGRTTMCPTELFYDRTRDEAYVRLLPIETRRQETMLSELRRDPKQWVHYPLEVDSGEQMEAALRELVQTKRVTIEEATRLGLYNPDMPGDSVGGGGLVEIPKWRHALVSFPHPLLKRGLTILDTPGLNALGAEPELTVNMLPSAQAVLFVLAADTGVTRSDRDMWQHYIKGFQTAKQRGITVVLNKIDVMWDELKSSAEITRAIDSQKANVATTLGIDQAAIFAVSAQKGLVAKVRKDDGLLAQSALLTLESHLSRNVLQAKQQIIIDTVGADIGHMIESSRSVVSSKLTTVKSQLEELEELSGKSDDIITQLMEKTREEQAQYMRDVDSFQVGRKKLKAQAKSLRDALNLEKLDRLIAETRREMTSSWTTHGLKSGMKTLFDEIRGGMNQVVSESEQTRKLIRSIYRKFQNEHGFSVIQPKMFSIMKFRVELELLHQEAEVFRTSPVTAMTEQNFVVKRFFTAMVSRAREIFQRALEEIDAWLGSTLEPLVLQIRDHKEMMEKRLNNLQKIGRSRSTLQFRIVELQDQYTDLARQLTTLRNMHNKLHSSRPLGERARPRPRLVSGQGAG